jgi:putative sigma-54 modulation protein
MQLAVTGRHLVVSDAVRQQIERKLAKLGRLLQDNAVSAQCVLTQERRQIVCELTVRARGDHSLVGVGKDVRMAAAVAAAVAKVAQQAQRLTDRWKTRRRTALRPERVDGVAAQTVPPHPPRVIRSRGQVIKAMTVDDAAVELDRSGQPVLVFRRSTTDAIAVVFRRPDGHVGLIDTGA